MAALPHRRACTYASQHVDNSDLEPVNPRRGAGTRRENSDLNSSYCLPRTRRMYRQPYYQRRYGQIRLPGAEAYYNRCLSLPLFVDMTENDVERVVSALRDTIS
jgi:hypothetical protein